jgi:tetratricopeptide (TPR) repeat protein
LQVTDSVIQAEFVKQAVALVFTSGGKVAEYLWKRLSGRRDERRLRSDPAALEAAVRRLTAEDPAVAKELRELVGSMLEMRHARPLVVPRSANLFDRVGAQAELGGSGVLVLSGPSGVGKTALAEHFGQRSQEAYPDGALLIDLADHRDGPGASLRFSQVRESVLRALGVDPKLITMGADELKGQYNAFLAPLRLLLIFDSVEGVRELQALVPPAPMSLVLALTEGPAEELVTQYPRHVPLSRLEEGADKKLFEAIAGTDLLAADPDGAREVLAECDRFPAMVVAAATAARQRAALATRPLKLLAKELSSGRALGPVSAAFDQVLGGLSQREQALCGSLSEIPGPSFTLDAAAAVADCEPFELMGELAHFESVFFLTQEPGGRLRLTKQARQALIRAGHAPGDEGFRRLVRFHRTRAVQADQLKMPGGRLRLYDQTLPKGTQAWKLEPGQDPVDPLLAEFPVYRALAKPAHDAGLHLELTQICGALEIVGLYRGHLRELVEITRWGIASAEVLGDVPLQLRTIGQQARLYSLLQEFPRAEVEFGRLRELLPRLEEPETETNRQLRASLWEFRGLFHRERGEYAEAATCFFEALKISRTLGGLPFRGQGLHSRMLANVLVLLGDLTGALQFLTEAESKTNPENKRDLAQVWLVRAKALSRSGTAAAARQALDLLPEVWRMVAPTGSDQYDLEIAEALGDAAWYCGDFDLARHHWSGVWQRLQAVRHPRAAGLHAKILNGMPPPITR